MKSRVTPRLRLIFPDRNLGVNPKKFAADGIGKSFKIIHKKGIAGPGREALNDITNKSTCRQEAPLRKQERAVEEIDIACEGFLHEHDKCIDSLKATMSNSFLDRILPGNDEDILQCYPDPNELFMHECDNWSKYLAKQHSPPCSALPWDRPSPSFSWPFEEPNFVLSMNDETDS